MEKIPDQDGDAQYFRAIIDGHEKDRLSQGLVRDIMTIFGFGRKGEKEKAVDALIQHEIRSGIRNRLAFIVWDEDTLIIENRVKKIVRWIPRVALGGILVSCLAYDPNVRGSVTKTFHTFKTNVTKTIEGFIKKQ